MLTVVQFRKYERIQWGMIVDTSYSHDFKMFSVITSNDIIHRITNDDVINIIRIGE